MCPSISRTRVALRASSFAQLDRVHVQSMLSKRVGLRDVSVTPPAHELENRQRRIARLCERALHTDRSAPRPSMCVPTRARARFRRPARDRRRRRGKITIWSHVHVGGDDRRDPGALELRSPAVAAARRTSGCFIYTIRYSERRMRRLVAADPSLDLGAHRRDQTALGKEPTLSPGESPSSSRRAVPELPVVEGDLRWSRMTAIRS